MRAVWSFWSKPFDAHKGRSWREPRHHLLAWALSLALARRHFAETQLVTDRAGKALLIDRLGLEFDDVSLALDSLDDADSGWWALGKLIAYSLQQGPFVHIDSDVFLWKALQPSLLSAPVLAQCPEFHSSDNSWCSPHTVQALFEGHQLSLPVEWEWASSLNTHTFREENCGILGGNRVDFLRYYATTAIRLIQDPGHRAAWAEVPEKIGLIMILVEQFLLTACLEYHRIDPASPYNGVTVRHLFHSWEEAYNPDASARVGFTHLLGDAKAQPTVSARLEQRVAQMDPGLARRCERVAGGV